MSPESLTAALKAEAQRLGFELAGACPAVTPPGIDRFGQWLDAGYAGHMHYLADRAAAYQHPCHVLEGARSLLMLGKVYRTAQPQAPAPGQGRVSCYAWGEDYHLLIHQRLEELVALHRRLAPAAAVRGVVDSAPLLEREFARLAGLGWIGKNTLLLDRRHGSWFFLAVLLTSEVLQYDPPCETEHCGTCRACLDACPTGALVQAHQLDARRCLSYLTIELRQQVPEEWRRAGGEWLFGCDLCQEVCPWNRRAPSTTEAGLWPSPQSNPAELIGLFELDDAAFRARFRHTPLWRPRRRGILRNAARVLGNQPHPAAVPALVRGLQDSEPLVRGACAWALGQAPFSPARQALQQRLAVETDEEVKREIQAALGGPR